MESVTWIDKQIYLLGLEKEAEQEQLKEKLDSLTASQCQELGLSLLNLEVESSCTSLYGESFMLSCHNDMVQSELCCTVNQLLITVSLI